MLGAIRIIRWETKTVNESCAVHSTGRTWSQFSTNAILRLKYAEAEQKSRWDARQQAPQRVKHLTGELLTAELSPGRLHLQLWLLRRGESVFKIHLLILWGAFNLRKKARFSNPFPWKYQNHTEAQRLSNVMSDTMKRQNCINGFVCRSWTAMSY